MHKLIALTGSSLLLCVSAYAVPSLQSSNLLSKRQPSSLVLPELVARFAGAEGPGGAGSFAAQCVTSGAKMPQAPTPMAAPSEGLVLAHVVVGRGTQNYTCADSTANSKPVADGAMASLFEATCLAVSFSDMLSSLPSIAVRFPVPQSDAADALLTGHHFFSDSTTPEFDLNTDRHQWGIVQMKKDSAVDAPDSSKDVQWLKLSRKSSDGCSVMEVYRVDTAGGVPPASCEGQPATIQVQYAANYWMYASPAGASANGTAA